MNGLTLHPLSAHGWSFEIGQITPVHPARRVDIRDTKNLSTLSMHKAGSSLSDSQTLRPTSTRSMLGTTTRIGNSDELWHVPVNPHYLTSARSSITSYE